jgi:hypothetical protein
MTLREQFKNETGTEAFFNGNVAHPSQRYISWLEQKIADERTRIAGTRNENTNKPIVQEVFCDNGEHSHWSLINPQTGEKLWSEDPTECKAMGHPVSASAIEALLKDAGKDLPSEFLIIEKWRELWNLEAHECDIAKYVALWVRTEASKLIATERGKHKEEEERLRMQLTACGVAAQSNTIESAQANRIDKNSLYWSASYSDVCDSVDREMELRTELFKREKSHKAEIIDKDHDLKVAESAAYNKGAYDSFDHHKAELQAKDKQMKEFGIECAKYGYDFHKTTAFPEHNFEDACINNFKQWYADKFKQENP